MPPASPALLPRDWYRRDVVEVATGLLGMLLRRGSVILRITEVEAYLGPRDTACHTARGRTPRNEAMWGPPGRAYVYVCYGMHQMLNVVCGGEPGAAVLIRAAEPVSGLGTIRRRRPGVDGPALLAGPGRVGQALALSTAFSGHPLYAAGGLELLAGNPPESILCGPRVGIESASPADRAAPLRFAAAGTRWVSRPQALSAASMSAVSCVSSGLTVGS